MTRHFLYVVDPMCSWCWGFSPVINQVNDTFGDDVPVRIVVGGLRPYTSHAMTDQDKDYVKNHWKHVRDASGQPFDFGFFDQEGFVYDTEPACRAIVTVRTLNNSRTLACLERIQRAFYAERKNTTDEQILADLAADVGFDRARFLAWLTSEQASEKTQGDFRFAQEIGVTGFPTLLAVDDGKTSLITSGHRSWKSLFEPLSTWVNARPTTDS